MCSNKEVSDLFEFCLPRSLGQGGDAIWNREDKDSLFGLSLIFFLFGAVSGTATMAVGAAYA